MTAPPHATAVYHPATDRVVIFDSNGGCAQLLRANVDSLIADIRAAAQIPAIARNLQAAPTVEHHHV